MDLRCRFCGSEPTFKTGHFVCENCKTVCFAERPTDEQNYAEQTYREISEYLQTVQKKIEAKKEEYYVIEQKYLLGQPLNNEEEKTRTCLMRFQKLRSDLDLIVSEKFSLSDKRTRQLLYEVLCISDELKAILEG